jgi:omega-amidase
MNSPKTFKAGIIQFDILLGNTDSNLETALKEIEAAAGQGAGLVLLPEMWSCGFDNSRLHEHAGDTFRIIEKLSQKAIQHRMIIAGSMPELSGGNIYNTMYVIDVDGSIAGAYRKVHLFSITGEDKFFSSGQKPVVCDTSIGPIGLMICYDLRFPELCRVLALKGAWAALVTAQWPFERISHWKTLLQARAVENQMFVVAANRSGSDPQLKYGGCSRVIAPFGNILAESDDNLPSTFIADIDHSEMKKYRDSIFYLNERVPAAYDQGHD